MALLPCHFVWRDGRASTDLDDLQAVIDTDPEATAYHLDAGHLQAALAEQGHACVVDGITGSAQAELFRERLRIYRDLAGRWEADGDFMDSINRMGSLFKKRSTEVLSSSRKKLGKWIGSLADVIGG